MPHGLIESKELDGLIAALEDILSTLKIWQEKGAAHAPPVDVADVQKAFSDIARRLQESGGDGRGLRDNLPKIAEQLRAAAHALDGQRRH